MSRTPSLSYYFCICLVWAFFFLLLIQFLQTLPSSKWPFWSIVLCCAVRSWQQTTEWLQLILILCLPSNSLGLGTGLRHLFRLGFVTLNDEHCSRIRSPREIPEFSADVPLCSYSHPHLQPTGYLHFSASPPQKFVDYLESSDTSFGKSVKVRLPTIFVWKTDLSLSF